MYTFIYNNIEFNLLYHVSFWLMCIFNTDCLSSITCPKLFLLFARATILLSLLLFMNYYLTYIIAIEHNIIQKYKAANYYNLTIFIKDLLFLTRWQNPWFPYSVTTTGTNSLWSMNILGKMLLNLWKSKPKLPIWPLTIW